MVRFNFQMVSSMNKSKKFGFLGYVDGFKSVRFWIGRLLGCTKTDTDTDTTRVREKANLKMADTGTRKW